MSIEVTIKTVSLTTKILKQMKRVSDWDVVRPVIQGKEGQILGWIDGSVIKEDYQWLLFKLGEDYFLFCCTEQTASNFPHLFVV